MSPRSLQLSHTDLKIIVINVIKKINEKNEDFSRELESLFSKSKQKF